MSFRSMHFWVAALATVSLASSACPAASPQAAFVLKDGWVTLTVTRDGRPVDGANIKAFDGRGQSFATGTTGEEGTGEFPLPPGGPFTVEIEIRGKVADPIRVTPSAAGLFPGEVLLSYGLAPCCRVPSRSWNSAGRNPANGSDADPVAGWLFTAGVAVVALAPPFLAIFLLQKKASRHERTT